MHFLWCAHVTLYTVKEILRNHLFGQWQGIAGQPLATFLEAGRGGGLRRFRDEKTGSNGLGKGRVPNGGKTLSNTL